MKNWKQGLFAVLAAATLCGVAAHAQTDVALSGYRTITSSSSGGGTEQTPRDSEGAMIELRHIVNPLVGFEAAVSFNPANQTYTPRTGACGFVCGEPAQEVSGKLTQFTLDWVASIKYGNLRPFALGGAGFAFTIPGSSPTVTQANGTVPGYAVNTVVRPAFVYGGGLDWGFLPHFGLRVQVRGITTKAPQLSDLYPSTAAYTQIYEPMGGVYYRFGSVR
jgi:hypothetical protein